MPKKNDFLKTSQIIIIILLVLLLLKGCTLVSCETGLFDGDDSSESTTTTHATTTTTHYEPPEPEYTCGETLQGICEGSCPDGQSCETINILFGETCKCIDVQGVN